MAHYPFKLPDLGYSYDALEPYIDAQTMELHYAKHHKSYVDKLNQALAYYPDLQNHSLEYLLTHLDLIPESIRMAIRNQGGGDYNHTFFWKLLKKNNTPELKNGFLKEQIQKNFESFAFFKEQFSQVARTVFGSGWAWLSLDDQDKLVVTATQNQDNPISYQLRPILGLDVWEHAYYLKYQNKRVDYIAAWWHVVNWQQVEDNLKQLL